MAHRGVELPRWGGVTEPVTVVTNVALAVLAFAVAARLADGSSARSSGATAWLAGAMLATGVAAFIGALAHGTDPQRAAAQGADKGAP